ncbi:MULTISPECIES: Fic family protein [Mumia]|uniref:Fic family protein n=1 Tax=Mumia TaxID=1546255 RepID=UPI00141E9D9A|nr:MULTISPECIES: Fic family protein [unclassified Mumia]QMW68150.1 Fic family protein [Mumia sp. ZJ1417]
MATDFPSVVFSADSDKDKISRAHKAGRLVQLGTGIYSPDVDKTTEQLVREHLWTIVAKRFPGAVIADRSARTNGLPTDGFLFVVHPRRTELKLAGVTVVPRQGPSAMPGDFALPGEVWLAGPARGILDNLVPTRPAKDRVARTLTRAEVELWIDEILAGRGEEAINKLRDDARALAPFLGRQHELDLLDKLVGAAMNTRPTDILQTPQLVARAKGQPYDRRRADVFTRLADYLDTLAPDSVPALPDDATRRTLLPFYEAYFSNYIEGTEFTLDEAAEIVFDDVVPEQRPEDAHDILGTYELTSSDEVMRQRPSTADELLDLLRRRHAILMAGRPTMAPGTFKKRANRAGETYFVAPELVEGTLKEGFDIGARLISPFARAAYLMFVVSEVHPFADGNGRVARVMMNAELAGAGEVRIVIPTVYRLNYLSALKGATHNENYPGLIAALSFARRWTARVDFTDRARAEADLVRTNALRDAYTAEEAGVRLTLP